MVGSVAVMSLLLFCQLQLNKNLGQSHCNISEILAQFGSPSVTMC